MSLSPVTPVKYPREKEISQTPGAPKKNAKPTHHPLWPIPIGAPLGHRTGAMWNQEMFDGRVIVTPWAWSKLDFRTSFEAGKKACEEKFRTTLMSKQEFLQKRSLCHTVDEATYLIIKENERDGIIVAPKPLASSSVTATLPSETSKKRSSEVSQDEGEPSTKKAKTNVTATTSAKPVIKAVAESTEQEKNPFDELMEDAVKAIEAKHAKDTRRKSLTLRVNKGRRKNAALIALLSDSEDDAELTSQEGNSFDDLMEGATEATKEKHVKNTRPISLSSDSEDEFSEGESRSPSPDICSSKSQMHTNRCIECGVDMGVCNPRQFCGKTSCLALVTVW